MIINAGTYRRNSLPVLNEAYPEDISEVVLFPYGGTYVTFEIKLLRGNLTKYRYQWYVNGVAVEDSNTPSFLFLVNDNRTTEIFCVIFNKRGESIQSRPATVTGKAAKQYLYEAGDQHTYASGGWDALAHGIPSYNEYYGAAELREDRMWMSGRIDQTYGGRCVTRNKINLRNYNTVNFACYCYGKITVAISSSQDTNGMQAIKQSTWTHTGWTGTLSIDVSDRIDEMYAICVCGPTQNQADYVEVFDVWLE